MNEGEPTYEELAAAKDADSVSTESKEPYPLGEFYKVVEGYDIHKSSQMWEAILVVEDQKAHKKHLRLYKWVKRDGKWKVDLARFSIGFWDLEAVVSAIRVMKAKYQL